MALRSQRYRRRGKDAEGVYMSMLLFVDVLSAESSSHVDVQVRATGSGVLVYPISWS